MTDTETIQFQLLMLTGLCLCIIYLLPETETRHGRERSDPKLALSEKYPERDEL